VGLQAERVYTTAPQKQVEEWAGVRHPERRREEIAEWPLARERIGGKCVGACI
jgi:hypothetical protein